MPVSENRKRMKTRQDAKNPPKKKKGNPTPWIVLAAVVLLVGGLIALFTTKPWRRDYYADIEIEGYGTITVFLDGHAAPKTVKNFVSLAKSGYYDGATFHRIMKGFMIESYIEDGNQSVDGGVYGKSITDACLGWNKTQKLIDNIMKVL